MNNINNENNKDNKNNKINNKKLRVFEGFAGIGAVKKGLDNLGIKNELVGFSEIDPHAIKSYCAIHNVDESLNYGDICLIDEKTLPDFDLFTFGSPCQDFSISGKQQGSVWKCSECGEKWNPLDIHWSNRDKCPHCESVSIEKTRSSLVVEALRVIQYKKPKYLLMENVKNLVNQFKDSFDKIINELEEYGYNTYWQVLNAKDYGIPQNRERVFVISIRKDIDDGNFKFPEKQELKLRLKDLLEDIVDEKFYYSKERTEKLLKIIEKKELKLDTGTTKTRIACCPETREYNGFKNISPTLLARDYKDPKTVIVFEERKDEGVRFFKNNTIGTIRTINSGGDKRVYDGFSIRKLTPKECWRLMGFTDEDFIKAEQVCSNTQLYKQAGNSIVVDVLESMFKILFQDYIL